MSILSVTSSPGRRLCPWDSSCSRGSSRGSNIHNRGPAGLQRGLGRVLQAAGCVLWTVRTGPRPASPSPARTGWYRGYSEVFTEVHTEVSILAIWKEYILQCMVRSLSFSGFTQRMHFPSTVCILDAVRVHGGSLWCQRESGRRDEEVDPEFKART